ncbi:hypothetical protein AAY42_10210 [Flagellimonas eckloniae]|uniref:Uncharacterized protein n=2 Tax=Flagellimonas eckloniae TaxID=346185 RepID=A0A0Q0XMF1_9FLAO|nr:hypothetical protein AAY42_10210 [Allomuricauda eckloniae]
MSFLPYLHDFEIFKGMEGFSGFSSLRVGIWVVSLFIVGLTGWIFAFLNARGKSYRLAMFAPIFMLFFQLNIYLWDARNTTTNEFTTKVLYNLGFALVLIAYYFINKSRNK